MPLTRKEDRGFLKPDQSWKCVAPKAGLLRQPPNEMSRPRSSSQKILMVTNQGRVQGPDPSFSTLSWWSLLKTPKPGTYLLSEQRHAVRKGSHAIGTWGEGGCRNTRLDFRTSSPGPRPPLVQADIQDTQLTLWALQLSPQHSKHRGHQIAIKRMNTRSGLTEEFCSGAFCQGHKLGNDQIPRQQFLSVIFVTSALGLHLLARSMRCDTWYRSLNLTYLCRCLNTEQPCQWKPIGWCPNSQSSSQLHKDARGTHM